MDFYDSPELKQLVNDMVYGPENTGPEPYGSFGDDLTANQIEYNMRNKPGTYARNANTSTSPLAVSNKSSIQQLFDNIGYNQLSGGLAGSTGPTGINAGLVPFGRGTATTAPQKPLDDYLNYNPATTAVNPIVPKKSTNKGKKTSSNTRVTPKRRKAAQQPARRTKRTPMATSDPLNLLGMKNGVNPFSNKERLAAGYDKFKLTDLFSPTLGADRRVNDRSYPNAGSIY
jgi:hypothetical protein